MMMITTKSTKAPKTTIIMKMIIMKVMMMIIMTFKLIHPNNSFISASVFF